MTVGYATSFVRQYKKLPAPLKVETKEKIALFVSDPNHSFLKVHKLRGAFKRCYSMSVNYSYRIVFEYRGAENVVLLAVGDHNIYQ